MLQYLADVLLLVALLLLVVGAGLIYLPAAFIVAGLGLAAMALRIGTRGGASA